MKSIILTHFSKPDYLGSVDSIKEENVDQHTLYSFVGKENIIYTFSLYKDNENYSMYLSILSKQDTKKIELVSTLNDSKKKIKEIMITVGFNSEDELLPELANLDFGEVKEDENILIQIYDQGGEEKKGEKWQANFIYKGTLVFKASLIPNQVVFEHSSGPDRIFDEISTLIYHNNPSPSLGYFYGINIKTIGEEQDGEMLYSFEDDYNDIIEEKRATIIVEGKEISTFEELTSYIFS